MAGQISGVVRRGPQVPMPEADPAYWDQQQADLASYRDKQEMANAAAVYEQMQRELRTYGRTLSEPQGARWTANTREGLGPIASQRMAAGDFPRGDQRGGLQWNRKPRKPSAIAKWANDKLKPDEVAEAIQSNVFDPLNRAGDTASYYIGPHATEAAKRSGEVGYIAGNMMPLVGDTLQLGQGLADYFSAGMEGDKWGMAKALGMGALGLSMFVPVGPGFGSMDDQLDDLPKWEKAKSMWDADPGTRDWDTARKIWKETGLTYVPGTADSFVKDVPDPVMRPEVQAQMMDPGSAWMGRWKEAFDGPEVSRYVPTVDDVPVYMENNPSIVSGRYQPIAGGGPSLSVEASTASIPYMDSWQKLYNAALHELQHHIFDVNGLPGGASPTALPEFVQQTYGNASFQDLMDGYQASTGEGFSNAVMRMADMDPMTRAVTMPYNAMPIPPEGPQWVRLISKPDADGMVTVTYGWADTTEPGGVNVRGTTRLRDKSGGKISKLVAGDELVDELKTVKKKGRISGMGPTSDELLQTALSTPRKISQRGTFVGAPPGVDTPDAENALINDIFNRLKGYEGTGERFYDASQEAVRQWTDDPQMARRFVSSSGHTSSMMSPLPNTNYAVKGMNQYAVGDDVNTGMFHNAQSPKVLEGFENDMLSPDPKTGQYSLHLLPPEYRPGDFSTYAFRGDAAVNPGRAVHDTWDRIVFGYPNAGGGSSDTEHLFMDRAYNKLVHMVSRDPALRAKYGTGPQAYERIQAALWDMVRRDAGKFDVLPMGDILDQTSGFTQMAAIPGRTTGASDALLNAPLNVKRQYTDEMFNAIATPDGANAPARALGMSPPMEEGFGPWQGMMEPNRTIRMAVASDGANAEKAINPSSAKMAKAVRHWNQFVLGQEGSGFTYPSTGGATKSTSDLVSIGDVKMDSPEAYNRAMREAEKVYGPQWADNVVVQPTPGSNDLMLKNISGRNNAEFGKMARDVSKGLGGGKISGMRDIGNDFTFVQFNDPSYRTLMDDTRNNPVLKRTFDEKVLPLFANVQAVSERWAKKMGVPANTVPDRVRRIFIEAGPRWPEAMDEAVKKGLIPAFAPFILYGAMRDQFGSEEGAK